MPRLSNNRRHAEFISASISPHKRTMHGASLVVFGPGHFSRIILHIIIIALALRIVDDINVRNS
jgi:hypothetical protein